MYVACLLCFEQHFHDLIVSSVTGIFVGLYKILSHIAYSDAPVVFDLAAAFASDSLLSSAGAYIQAVFIVFFQPVRELLIRNSLALAVNRLFDRDYMHSESAAAFRHHVGYLAYRNHGSIVEECGDLRMLFHKLSRHQHVFA